MSMNSAKMPATLIIDGIEYTRVRKMVSSPGEVRTRRKILATRKMRSKDAMGPRPPATPRMPKTTKAKSKQFQAAEKYHLPIAVSLEPASMMKITRNPMLRTLVAAMRPSDIWSLCNIITNVLSKMTTMMKTSKRCDSTRCHNLSRIGLVGGDTRLIGFCSMDFFMVSIQMRCSGVRSPLPSWRLLIWLKLSMITPTNTLIMRKEQTRVTKMNHHATLVFSRCGQLSMGWPGPVTSIVAYMISGHISPVTTSNTTRRAWPTLSKLNVWNWPPFGPQTRGNPPPFKQVWQPPVPFRKQMSMSTSVGRTPQSSPDGNHVPTHSSLLALSGMLTSLQELSPPLKFCTPIIANMSMKSTTTTVTFAMAGIAAMMAFTTSRIPGLRLMTRRGRRARSDRRDLSALMAEDPAKPSETSEMQTMMKSRMFHPPRKKECGWRITPSANILQSISPRNKTVRIRSADCKNCAKPTHVVSLHSST
mmetsp:Transcript_17994/g.51601  ORF Transcript_17994/g.51601 Transcript_17994/m.51601 type:complete len:475 (+) Transcript_17994:1067-2491(+)